MRKIEPEAIPWSLGDAGVRYLQQGPDLEWGILKMKPGQSSKDYGRHIHRVVEETFYLLSGSLKVIINGEEHRLEPGQALVVEPNDYHDLINDTSEDIVALFMKHPYLPEDRIPV